MNNNTNDFWLKLEALQFDRMYPEKKRYTKATHNKCDRYERY